jgi:hypothetical protein
MKHHRHAYLLPIALAAGIAHAAAEQPSQDSKADKEPAQIAPRPVSQGNDAGDSKGIKAGSFMLYPKLTLGMRFDDNIYATPDNVIDDMILTVSPALEARSGWQRHALSLSAGANIARYQDYTSEDTEDYWLEAKGRYDLSDRAKLIAGARHAFAHEDRESADDLAAIAPTTYRDDMLYGGIEQRFDSGLSLRLAGSYRQLDYDNVPNTLLQTNDDRDRDRMTGAIRLGYAMQSGYQWFAQAALDRRSYRLPLDDAGYHRDSSGYRLQTGIQWRRGPFSGDAFIGHMTQDYDDAGLSDVSAPDFGTSLNWQVGTQTTLHVAVERAIEETTQAGASSYLSTSLNAGLSHKLRPDLGISGSLGMMTADYQGLSREDDFIEAALGIKYELSRRTYLAGNYRFLERDSNDDAFDFDRNQVSLLVGWQF